MTKREFAEVIAVRVNGKVHEVNKNGLKLTGIIREGKQGSAVAYIDDHYEDGDIEGAVEYVKGIIDMELDHNIDLEEISKYEFAKDKLRTMLVRIDWQGEDLVIMPFGDTDLGIVFYVEISSGMSFKVTKDIAEEWGVTASELWVQAKKEEPVLQDMVTAMFGGGDENYLTDMPDEIPPMMILRNKDNFRGASAIVGHLKEISDVVGGDFVLLPSSIHEVLIVPINPEDKNEIDKYTQLVRQVNGDVVDPEERLSDHAYYYDSNKGILHA